MANSTTGVAFTICLAYILSLMLLYLFSVTIVRVHYWGTSSSGVRRLFLVSGRPGQDIGILCLVSCLCCGQRGSGRGGKVSGAKSRMRCRRMDRRIYGRRRGLKQLCCIILFFLILKLDSCYYSHCACHLICRCLTFIVSNSLPNTST